MVVFHLFEVSTKHILSLMRAGKDSRCSLAVLHANHSSVPVISLKNQNTISFSIYIFV